MSQISYNFTYDNIINKFPIDDWVVRVEIVHQLQECPNPDNGNYSQYEFVVENEKLQQKFSIQGEIVNNTISWRSCDQKRFDYLHENTKYRNDDVMILTYPKCGTTFTEQICLLLMHGTFNDSNVMMNPYHKNTYIPNINVVGKIWIEACVQQDNQIFEKSQLLEFKSISWDQFDSVPCRRLIKTHASYNNILGMDYVIGVKSLPKDLKMLCIIRNPLDACISSFYHGFNPHKSGWSFDAWSLLWLSGLVSFGSYFQWIKGWYNEYLENKDKMMLIFYEDLVSNPTQEILRIANFLDIDYNEEFINNIVHLSSFDIMKEQSIRNEGSVASHLRKGVIGDWKEHFTNPNILVAFKEVCYLEFKDTVFDRYLSMF